MSLLILVVDDECDVEMLFAVQARPPRRAATRWILPSRRIFARSLMLLIGVERLAVDGCRQQGGIKELFDVG